jgi:hypothetical protein
MLLRVSHQQNAPDGIHQDQKRSGPPTKWEVPIEIKVPESPTIEKYHTDW